MAAVVEKGRQSFTVPAASGSYAFERLTFGVPANSAMPEISLQGITVNVDASVASSSVELWLPRLDAGSKHPSAFVDSDYTYSGYSVAVSGAMTVPLAGYPGAQVRVKSGGSAGTATISATVF